jgi:sulfhydrogenase subunit gamma (sulfur reductase)
MMHNPHRPHQARVVERIQESGSVFTLRLEFLDSDMRDNYRFAPGQFNMVYLYGVGEVAISIVSDPKDPMLLDHTIRAVGRVTNGISQLKDGDIIGLRGPYGRGWPMVEAEGRDVVVITGGLGCAPVVSVINYITQRREQFGKLTILQGVKLPKDLIWRDRFERWINEPNTEVFLAADKGDPSWPWHVGLVIELFDQMKLSENTIVMMCGPEGMMRVCIHELLLRNVPEDAIYLSMERNMQCALGQCGHCQFGPDFVCKDGPVFSYDQIKPLFAHKGF